MNPWELGLGAASGLMGAFMPSGYGQYASAMNRIGQQFAPYEQRGVMADKGMLGLGAYNMANPAGLENRLASSFTNSPYQNRMQTNLRNQMNANSAATGMLGSTAQQAALQNALAGQENQFMNQYINRGTQQYNLGEQNLMGLGRMLSQQGYGAQEDQAQMEAAAARAKFAGGNPFTDALSGIMGVAMPFMSGAFGSSGSGAGSYSGAGFGVPYMNEPAYNSMAALGF